MASIIFDISIPTNDPWELIYLAGGDPTVSSYDTPTTTLTNLSVTQLALDQALIDFTNGVQSAHKVQLTKDNAEDVITPTDLALATLGDAAAIAKLQSLVATTASIVAATLPPTPPTSPSVSSIKNNNIAIIAPVANDDVSAGYSIGSLWIDTIAKIGYICVDSTTAAAIWHRIDTNVSTSSLNNYTATINPATTDNVTAGYSVGSIWVNNTSSTAYLCLSATALTATWHQLDVIIPKFRYVGSTALTPATTLFTNIPFADSITILPNGFTNAAGLITVTNTGTYTISVTLPYITTVKYQLQQIRILHNLLPVGPISKQEAGKKTFNGTLNISSFPIHLISGDTISIQYLGTTGTTYSAYLHIEELGA